MWLLSTDRAELHFFATPQDVPDGYAILSHVWDMDGPEQSFQDTELLAAKYSGPTDSPRKHASRKVRECCKLAQKHGFSWLWIDTCCIDKRSSAELSEAINSMFRYYQLARICYVYLFDMEIPPIPSPAMESAFVTRHPSERNITSDPSLTIMFSNSKWHKRGWTLQELLASKFVAFFSRDWQLLGSKSDLSSLLEAITRIPQTVLTLQTPLSSVSISGRMQWAAERKTTRPEDEAYCLLGIFDITMPLLYGEGGPKAFLRLQEEIIKQSRGTTLFSWTSSRGWTLPPLPLQSLLSELSYWKPDSTAHEHVHNANDVALYLFARSPREFSSSGLSLRFDMSRFEEIPHAATKSIVTSQGPPSFSITPYGVRARVPVIEAQGAQLLIALLGWTSSLGKHYGLLLSQCPNRSESSYNFYDIGVKGHRLVQLDQGRRELPASKWVDIYLLHKPSLDSDASGNVTGITSLPLAALTTNFISPFRFMRHHLDSLQEDKSAEESLMKLDSVSNGRSLDDLNLPWTGVEYPMMLTFTIPKHDAPTHHTITQHSTVLPRNISRDAGDGQVHNCQAKVVLQIGLCSTFTQSTSRHELARHWAKIHLFPLAADAARTSPIVSKELSTAHDCSVDHIYAWPNLRKEAVIVLPQSIGVYEYCLMKLSFSSCTINPASLISDVAILPISVFPRRLFSGSPQQAAEERRRMLRRKLSAFADEIHGKSAFEVIPEEFSPPLHEASPLAQDPLSVEVPVTWFQESHHAHSWIKHEFEDLDWISTPSLHHGASSA